MQDVISGYNICKSKTLYQGTYISTACCGTKARRYIKVHLHVYLQQTGNTKQDVISRCTQIKNVTSKRTYISRANWGTHRRTLYRSAHK